MPHLLTDEQKRQRIKVAKKLLQMFPKYDKKQFANVFTGDETWVHYFEPIRKVSNKIWATKHSKRPIIAKRSLSTKKVILRHARFRSHMRCTLDLSRELQYALVFRSDKTWSYRVVEIPVWPRAYDANPTINFSDKQVLIFFTTRGVEIGLLINNLKF